MKKIFKGFLVFMMIFSFIAKYKALDEREVLTEIVVTSNTSSIPNYKGVIASPVFNITSGSEAHFDTSQGFWRRLGDNGWVTRFNGYKFNSGSWQYRVKVLLDGEASSTLRLANQTKIYVDGVEWTFSYCSTCAEGNTTMGYAISPKFDIEATGELFYYETDSYVVYTNYIDNPINSFSVSKNVEGGVEPYVFSKVSGPTWINISTDGILSGTPSEIGDNADLIVRVTDANEDYSEITIPVGRTVLPPALREPIELIEATSNIDIIPVIGSDIVVPTFNVTTTEGSFFAGYAGGWYKLVADKWQKQTGKFTPGIWRYYTEIVLQNENAEMQRLTDDTVVKVDGEIWASAISGYGNEYYALGVTSKEYNLVGKIDSIELESNIKTPKVGEDIVEPIIWISKMNGDNSLINNADIEAFWQYKTGDGFFDWANATGKFESDKTYHIRLLITINSDSYELSNIATFPVTLNGYNLTQFQLNNKTVGEFIEFDMLKEISVPVVSINNNNDTINLSWASQSGATRYEVYKSINNKSWYKVANTTTNKYSQSKLTYNKTFYYKVRACDESKCTAFSKVVSRKIRPNKVVLSVKNAGTYNIRIKYDKVSTSGYEVYRSTNNKSWKKIKTITKNSTLEYNNTSLKANKTYYYKVRAYKKVSGRKVYGPWSNVVSTKTAPKKPSLKAYINNYDEIKVVVGYTAGSSKYYVYKSTDGKTYEEINVLTSSGSVIDGGNTIGKTYYYQVKACNNKNNCSGRVTVKIKQTTKTPGFSLTTSSKKVTIKFNKVLEADGYEIARATRKKGKYTTVKTLLEENEIYTFENTTKKGTTYYYKIRSYKVVNGSKVYSSWSPIKSIKSK